MAAGRLRFLLPLGTKETDAYRTSVTLNTKCWDHVRQAGVKSGVVELVTDHAAMVAISLGTASIVGGVSSAMASVCM